MGFLYWKMVCKIHLLLIKRLKTFTSPQKNAVSNLSEKYTLKVYGKGTRTLVSELMGPSFVFKTFQDIGLNHFPEDLREIVQAAYRAAFKIALGKVFLIFP